MMKRFLLISLLSLTDFIGSGINRQALAQGDSLMMADTIHSSTSRYLLSTLRQYSYRYASHLMDVQLVPLLQKTSDPTVQKFIRKGRFSNGVRIVLSATGFSFMMTGLLMPRYPVERSGVLMLSGIGLFYGALIPLGQARRQYLQAVLAHNEALRSRTDTYLMPVINQTPEIPELSLADTVAVWHRRLAYRYVYREVPLQPAQQLVRLVDRLNDGTVKAGFQYNRRVKTIAGLLGGLGASYLTTSLLLYAAQRSHGNAPILGTPLVWGSLAAVTFSYGLKIQANKAQLSAVQLLNSRLRDQYSSPARYEHFSIP